MPRMLRMPPAEKLPPGPHRDFVEELFVHYREANRPTLREIAQWIQDHQDERDLPGTASTETIRRVMNGTVVPGWPTVETILEALCGIAGRDINEPRYPHARSGSRDRRQTFWSELRTRWNAAIDSDDPEDPFPTLPRRPRPAPTPAPALADDPWAVELPNEEPPF